MEVAGDTPLAIARTLLVVSEKLVRPHPYAAKGAEVTNARTPAGPPAGPQGRIITLVVAGEIGAIAANQFAPMVLIQ